MLDVHPPKIEIKRYLVVKTSRRQPTEKKRYYVRGRFFPYPNEIIEACIYWDGFWHVAKICEIIEWLEEVTDLEPDG